MNKLIGYASSFSAYLISRLSEENKLKEVKQVILFGSVARGTAEKDSDVDIFINVSNPKLEIYLHKLTESFYLSKEAIMFKLRGIDNKINIVVGKISEWADLEKSIISNGKVLWGPFTSSSKGSEQFIIFYWEDIKRNRGAFLNKLYGFTVKGHKYSGLLEKWGGKRIGKSCILIPAIHKEELTPLLKDYSVSAKIIECFI